MVHRRAVLVALAALLGACAPISRDFAPAYDAPGRTVATSPVSLSVDSVGGAPLPTYALGDAVFVEGREGEGYTVRLTNHTPNRYEAVVTVDGRDVVSGELGRPAKQRGYVLEPYETLVIDGYRRSLDEVAAFYFASRYDSYTARRGTAEHAGVIGVALFEEKRTRSKPQPLTRKLYGAAPEPFPAAPSSREAADGALADSEEHLGTGYGASEYSPVHETDFKRRRKARPDAVLTVYYDSEEGLQARGLLPRRVDVGAPDDEPDYGRRDAVDPRFAPPPWQRDR
ncbi:MAG: hypothetical protein ACRBN8_26620 [Nannocystales bacterium]